MSTRRATFIVVLLLVFLFAYAVFVVFESSNAEREITVPDIEAV